MCVREECYMTFRFLFKNCAWQNVDPVVASATVFNFLHNNIYFFLFNIDIAAERDGDI